MLLLIICSMLVLGAQDSPPCAGQQDQLRPEIFQHWVHSHEEDENGLEVFRPHSYPFPRARGRNGFEVKKNGEFILYKIARGDGSEEVPGRWKAEGKNRIIVSFDDRETRTLTIEVVTYDKDILKIRAAPE